MNRYAIVNRISNLVVWQGTMKDAQALCYNPFVTEKHVKDYANRMEHDLFILVE